MPVAWADTHKDAVHYALVYLEDGPVKVQERTDRKWKTVMWFDEGDDDE